MSWQISIVGGLLGFLAFFAWVSFQLDKQHKPLKFGFLWLCFFIMILINGVLVKIADDAAKTSIATLLGSAMWLLVSITVFVSFYLVVYYVKTILEWVNNHRQRKEWEI